MGSGLPRSWRCSARAVALLGGLGLLAGACGGPDRPIERAAVAGSAQAQPAASDDDAQLSDLEPSPTTTSTAAPPPTVPPTTAPAPPPATQPPIPRTVVETGFAPFATAEHLVLLHPAALVERIGFHEAGHDGTRHLAATAAAARPVVLESRQRGTGPQTAADIVVPPGAEIRAPVTGTVKRAGTYVLYCDNVDDYAVIEPDDRPGWEVKVLHITGVQVEAGQRVEAAVTVLAPGPTILPFASQVDDHTADPPWPHVHIEVVDPSIPDKPNPGEGSDC